MRGHRGAVVSGATWPITRVPDSSSVLAELEVQVPVLGGPLGAWLCRPSSARAAVVVGLPRALAHHSSSERFAATMLARAGFATLLLDLLREDEDEAVSGQSRAEPADVPLMALRLASATHWLGEISAPDLPVGYLGVDDAAPAALVATAFDLGRVFAVVTRGGHPERAGASVLLAGVPALFLSAQEDGAQSRGFVANRSTLGTRGLWQVLQFAAPSLAAGAALDRVVAVSTAWFTHWLGGPTATRAPWSTVRPWGCA